MTIHLLLLVNLFIFLAIHIQITDKTVTSYTNYWQPRKFNFEQTIDY